ncbi:MAG: hypothetical protein J2P17_09445, partial [Mycobacterium sp.]|nr:hypothetical protein [Mycobacterium sp.]
MAGPTVLVRFIGDASGLTKATDQVERKNEGLRGSFKKVALAAAGAFVATHVVDFVKDSIKAGQDLNAAQSRTATIFGQSAGEVEKWGSTASKNLRLPKAEALGAANTIGKTLVGSFGMSEKSAAGMSMGVVNLAKDMATFNRVPFDEALQKVTGGLNGQTRGLKTLGVSMSATEIQAKALSMGFGKTTVDMGKLKTAQLGVERAQGTYNAAVKKFGPNSEQARRAQIGLEQAQLRVETAMKGGKTTLTASEKAQASYALMLDKTKLQQGANEKAGDSLKGQQERMRAEWTNAKATLGQALIPVLTQLATIFTEKIVPILQKAARFIKENSGWLIPLIGIIIGIIGVIKIWTAVQTALNLVMSANPIVLIVLAVIALVAGIIYLATKTQFFQTIWKAMTDAIAAAWNWVWGILKGIFNAIVGAFDAVKNAITVAKDWIVARFNDVVNFITGIPGRIAAFGRIMFDSVKNAITAAKDWIVARFNDAITFITGLPGRIAEFGRRMFDSVKEAALAVDRWIIEKFNDAVNFIKGIPGRIAEVAVNMFNSVKNAMTSAKDWVRDRVNDVVGFFTGLPGRIGRAVSSIKEKIMAPFKWVAEKVWNVFAGAVNWLGRKVGLPEIPKINLTGKAKGGRVPGGWGGGDQVPALLEPGEWVLTKHQARGIGYHRLRNLPHYQAGGEVGGGGHVPIMPTFGFGDVWDAAKSIGVGVLGNIEDVFDSVTGYLRRAAFVAFEKLTSPLRSLLEKAANDPHYFKSAIARFGVKILDNTLEFIRGKTEPELNVGGMRIDDVVKTVRDRFPQLVVTSALRRGDPG